MTYEEDVGEDAAQHAGLDNANLAILQSHDGDLRKHSD